MIHIKEKVSLIVCAYNEEKNIQPVLDFLNGVKWLDQIIIVNDGSSDKTSEIIKQYKRFDLIEHRVNRGKGAAIASGVKAAKNDLLVFLDADLIGLRESHLFTMLSPVLFTKEADLSLGIFGKGEISVTNFANKLVPSITGQRVIRKKNLPTLKELKDQKYGVDITITKSVSEDRVRVVKLDGLSQVIKEEKDDKLMHAVKKRVIMYMDIYKSVRNSKRAKIIK
jgi:glycosyltransferase involved in cell wall biosynthesis